MKPVCLCSDEVSSPSETAETESRCQVPGPKEGVGVHLMSTMTNRPTDLLHNNVHTASVAK